MATSRSAASATSPTVSFGLTAAPFFSAAARRGIALPPSHDGRVDLHGFFSVAGALFRMQPERSMGLALRNGLGPSADPELRALVQCAPTIEDALTMMGEVRALFFDGLSLDVIPDGRHIALRLQFIDTDDEGAMELAAGVLGGALAYATQTCGALPEHRVVLRGARYADAHLRTVFSRVSEGVREDFLLLPRSLLRVRPKSANESLFDYFAAEARARSERRLWATSTRERVRTRLDLEAAPLRASVTTVAESLGLCSRTLQRRLSEEGTTFARVQGSVLRHRAVQALATTPARAVARSLGYADASAFHRAVVAWSGTTPGELGEALRA
jgi:AraC-like DNA-binding protein